MSLNQEIHGISAELRLKLFAIPEVQQSDSTLSIETESDYVKDVPKNTLTLDLNAAGSGYGVNPYGTAPYGDIAQPNFKTKLNGKYKSMRIKFINAEDQQNVELTGWELEIATPYRPEIKE